MSLWSKKLSCHLEAVSRMNPTGTGLHGEDTVPGEGGCRAWLLLSSPFSHLMLGLPRKQTEQEARENLDSLWNPFFGYQRGMVHCESKDKPVNE